MCFGVVEVEVEVEVRKITTRSARSLSLCSFPSNLTASTARARASWASACSAAVKGFRLFSFV